MKIESTYQIQAPRQRVYEYLAEPEVLQRCIPGCERLEKTGEKVYSATIRTGVGAVRGVFTGTVKLEELRPPEHFRIVVEGKGIAGSINGTGVLDLEALGKATVIKYAGDLQVSGDLASTGQRMIQGTTKMIASQFFLALQAEAKSAADEPPPPDGLSGTARGWFSGLLQKLFSPH